MKQNNNNLAHMAIIMMIMCNGICVGGLVGDMRFMLAHGFDKTAAIDTVIQATLVAYTYGRIKYYYHRIKDNENTK